MKYTRQKGKGRRGGKSKKHQEHSHSTKPIAQQDQEKTTTTTATLMLRRNPGRFLGYTPVNPDTSPMIQYSNYHWHYNLPQGMERPHSINRRLPAPFQGMHRNVNQYKPVWIGEEESYSFPSHRLAASSSFSFLSRGSSRFKVPIAYHVALKEYFEKLPHDRIVPSTPIQEIVDDFQRISPQIEDDVVKDYWLSKVFQHCAFAREGEMGMRLWEQYVAPRYMSGGPLSRDTKNSNVNNNTTSSEPQGSTPDGSSRPNTLSSFTSISNNVNHIPPPLPLVKGILFLCSKSDHKGWRTIFDQCLKPHWNLTPYFDTAQWSFLLKSIGRQGDEQGVRVVLEEMLDVKADLDRVEARSIVYALNAVKDKEIYNYIKSFLFHFGERKVKFLRLTYSDLRGHGASKLRIPLVENDNMFYHVCWHESIRQPRRFSPRQLYFDYTPSSIMGGAQDPDGKIDEIVKDKIEKWKSEGLLPEDYVHEDRVYDRATAFKNVARQEQWKKMPRIVKSRRFGYTGD